MEPEVAGGVGEDTLFSKDFYTSGHRKVEFLHYVFSGWLGDSLLETVPCYIVSQPLVKSIQAYNLTGYQCEEMKVTMDESFLELHPKTVLPLFLRLLPLGRVNIKEGGLTDWSGHDFCLGDNMYLFVSERALDVLELHQINHCEVAPVPIL
ncbi:hypothetical protein [Mechercharimyces sp. CAU 1602]|uniref:hypothetical protein n=1 Tax=Mechercharimyces sp. CAU 1602 TaxID=2973933 RepID=UPI002161F1FA|nr:hypothetical protein [Mechercharimyces sp. CAU 1602]